MTKENQSEMPFVAALPSSNHGDRAHAKISPSKLKSLEICPRYKAEQSDPHPITLRGTAMHEALDSGKDDGLDLEELGYVAMCRDFVNGCIEPGSEILTEIRLEIAGGVWGFADLVILSPDKQSGWLIDYKFSTQLQEDAETNPAAQAYALGLFKKFIPLETLRVAYLYPRLEQISEATFDRSMIPLFEARIATIRARVEGGAEPYAQADNCLYCAQKVQCTALHRLALPIATRYADAHDELTIPAEYQPSEIKNPAVMARAFEVALVMEKWVESVKHHARELRFNTGAELPGFDFRTRAGRKRVISPEGAYAFALKAGITHDEFLTTVEVSATKLTDLVEGKAAKGEKARAGQAFMDCLQDEGVVEAGPETYFFARQKKTTSKQLNNKQ